MTGERPSAMTRQSRRRPKVVRGGRARCGEETLVETNGPIDILPHTSLQLCSPPLLPMLQLQPDSTPQMVQATLNAQEVVPNPALFAQFFSCRE
jgi:hypothetical protein